MRRAFFDFVIPYAPKLDVATKTQKGWSTQMNQKRIPNQILIKM